MTDREFLDYAAKAIGEQLSWMTGDKAAFIGDEIWDPLGDDGDALRLAVKLGITIAFVSRDSYTGD